jgi:hypothetical protein
MDNRIKVGIRIRPFSSKENQENNGNYQNKASITANEENGQVNLQNNKDEMINNIRNKNSFQFDWSFDQDSTQDKIYESMCHPLIEKFFEGYNATFFACKSQQRSSFFPILIAVFLLVPVLSSVFRRWSNWCW